MRSFKKSKGVYMVKGSGKKDKVAQFVKGEKQTVAPKPKSLTPGIKAKDQKRMGVNGKAVKY
jgi:hypothetical protein